MQDSLFDQFNQEKQLSNTVTKASEESYRKPLTSLVQNVTLNHPIEKSHSQTPYDINKSLDELFPEQQHDGKKIQKAKQILGSLVNDFTDEQLKYTVSEVEYLTESWLDEFERQIFEGLTLNELLHERGDK